MAGRGQPPFGSRSRRRSEGRSRKLSYRGCDVGPRCQLRDDRFDLAPAAVTRPLQHGLVVLRREGRAQHPNRRQRQLAGREEIEDHRKPPARACRRDPIARRVLGEAQDLRAIGEERAATLGGIQRGPHVERGKVCDELGGCLTLPACEHCDASEQLLIAKVRCHCEQVRIRHGSVYHGCFLTRRKPLAALEEAPHPRGGVRNDRSRDRDAQGRPGASGGQSPRPPFQQGAPRARKEVRNRRREKNPIGTSAPTAG